MYAFHAMGPIGSWRTASPDTKIYSASGTEVTAQMLSTGTIEGGAEVTAQMLPTGTLEDVLPASRGKRTFQIAGKLIGEVHRELQDHYRSQGRVTLAIGGASWTMVLVEWTTWDLLKMIGHLRGSANVSLTLRECPAFPENWNDFRALSTPRDIYDAMNLNHSLGYMAQARVLAHRVASLCQEVNVPSAVDAAMKVRDRLDAMLVLRDLDENGHIILTNPHRNTIRLELKEQRLVG